MTQPDARAERRRSPDCCPGGLLHTTDCPVYLDNVARREAREARAERTEPATGEDLWMLDLDERDWPWRAHLIVEDDGEWRTTACGDRVNEVTHPRGWRRCKPGSLPMSRGIHCGELAALDLPGRAPTQWAYDQTCKALEKHRARADAAEAELTKARAQIEQLRADRTWDTNRANEAARLSAEARDRADDLAKELAAAREHADIVEQGRSDLIVLIHRAQEAMPDGIDPDTELDRQVRALAAALDEAQEDARQAWFYLSRSRAEVAKGIAADIGRWIDDEVPTEFDEVEEGVTMTHRGRIYRPRGFFHLGPDPRKPYRFVLGWGTINFRGENYELNYDQFCVWLARDNKKTIYLYRGRWRDHRD